MKNSPFPWLIPGALSRQVTATNSVSSPGSASTVTILTYTVPEGYIFSLRGVSVGVNDPGALWVEGSAQLVFTLSVETPGGSRPVDWFASLSNRIGSEIVPYPIVGRSEFEENNILTWTCVSDGTVTGANLFAHLMGFERPLLGAEGV